MQYSLDVGITMREPSDVGSGGGRDRPRTVAGPRPSSPIAPDDPPPPAGDASLADASAVRTDLRRFAREDWDDLLGMYLTFEPKGAYQGLPPYREETTRAWLAGLVDNEANANLVLWIGGEAAGHVAIVHYPAQPRREEIMVFMHQRFRRKGWGRELLLAAMNEACRGRGCEMVWVTVDWENGCARRLYDGLGFRCVSREALDAEIEMERPMACAECLKDECPVYRAGAALGGALALAAAAGRGER
jgi:RimJ/RimL family protein N-acetyltransferase